VLSLMAFLAVTLNIGWCDGSGCVFHDQRQTSKINERSHFHCARDLKLNRAPFSSFFPKQLHQSIAAHQSRDLILQTFFLLSNSFAVPFRLEF
jgi:hypothetical protein